jgi:choline kinase
MDIFLLGAGKPAHGQSPTALKQIALDTKVMDWQIHSFESVASIESIHYLGGYHVEDVVAQYPNLNFTINPHWKNQSALETLLKAPFTGDAIFSYSDTVFRKPTIEKMIDVGADMVYCIDSIWKQRYKHRSQEDLKSAETIKSNNNKIVEFTGLVYLKAKVIQYLKSKNAKDIGSNVLDLIRHLKSRQFNVKEFDVSGNWAEFNSPNDIAKFILGTKADTLARLEPRVTKSTIGKQVNFTVASWNDDPQAVLSQIKQLFGNSKLIIRSSSKGEDSWFCSNAGGYESILNIKGNDEQQIIAGIKTVISSYGKISDSTDTNDQVLVQEQLLNVKVSGVVFTCGLETGSPYYRFNFDDKSDSTESVTAGTDNDLRTIIINRFGTEHLENVEPKMVKVLRAIKELEKLLGYDKLDIEFAIDNKDQVHIFQVRPITVDHSDYEIDLGLIKSSLQVSKELFESQTSPPPFVYGDKTIFANMPDWNPAEIIGTSPKPLAFSLYRQLIANKIWGIQRAEYGYRNTQPCPLIYSLSGQPYVDVRASINSFIPETVANDSAKRLAQAYLQILADNPQFHDKLEFDVLFTIWTPEYKSVAPIRFKNYSVSQTDIEQLEQGLKQLTCKALTRLNDDIASIKQLPQRRDTILSSKIPIIDKVYCLIEDCKEFGTLAFSHAARAGFVATTILKSLVTNNKLSDERRLEFLNSFKTVAGEFEKAKYAHSNHIISDQELVKEYGHLRPGTYEITTQAYWEDVESYLNTENSHKVKSIEKFEFNPGEQKGLQQFLTELGSGISVTALHDYLMEAIIAREYVKFEFTKNLSAALDCCVQLGLSIGISRQDMAFLHYSDFLKLKLNALNKKQLKKIIKRRKQQHIATVTIELPSVIQCSKDLYAFERINSLPNFVTINRIEAIVEELKEQGQSDLSGKLVMIPQADPGYDWLFGHNIAGLITKYGGANSHMAIRAAEIDLPAAIGVGEKLYEKITYMKKTEMDCANKIIREIF